VTLHIICRGHRHIVLLQITTEYLQLVFRSIPKYFKILCFADSSKTIFHLRFTEHLGLTKTTLHLVTQISSNLMIRGMFKYFYMYLSRWKEAFGYFQQNAFGSICLVLKVPIVTGLHIYFLKRAQPFILLRQLPIIMVFLSNVDIKRKLPTKRWRSGETLLE